MRAVSSVLDAAVFLLLVGAAAMALTLPVEQAAAPGAAAETATVLATTTATVEYSLAPGARRAGDVPVEFPTASGPAFRRTAHGTLAAHLAGAAVSNRSLDGRGLSSTRSDFVAAVTNATLNATRNRGYRTAVRATWRPYSGAPLVGRVRVGPTPPPSATVHAASVTVASGLPTARSSAQAVGEHRNVTAVAHLVAGRVVDGTFPASATRSALLSGYPTRQLVTVRYVRLARALDTDVTGDVRAADVAGANRALTEALTDRFAADMHGRFETAMAAADAVRVGRVRITVRTWSP